MSSFERSLRNMRLYVIRGFKPFDASQARIMANKSIGKFVAIGILNGKNLCVALDFFNIIL